MPITIQSIFSPQQQAFIDSLKAVTPKPFLRTETDPQMLNFKLLGMAQFALTDYNTMEPREGYTFNSLPIQLYPLIQFGAQFYIATMAQMGYSMIDLQYSDNGLSISQNRTEKLGTSIQNLEKIWLRMLGQTKRGVTMANGGMGLATPRYNSQLSRFISMLNGGSAFGWNIP